MFFLFFFLFFFAAGLKPIFLWIHGGGFHSQAGSLFDGSILATKVRLGFEVGWDDILVVFIFKLALFNGSILATKVRLCF